MDDSLFQQTFMVQILIFAQAIMEPIGLEQKSLFKPSKDEGISASKIAKQAIKLLNNGQSLTASTGAKKFVTMGKRTFGESLVAVVQKSEPQWAAWKEEKCKSFEIRAKNERIVSKLKARRESRMHPQRKLLNQKAVL